MMGCCYEDDIDEVENKKEMIEGWKPAGLAAALKERVSYFDGQSIHYKELAEALRESIAKLEA